MSEKLAIIGASYLQSPLILKAKSMGLETHVFAWEAGDVGERQADYFYPISIVENDAILSKCHEIGIDGVCTIASDLASIAVGYVANAMGLTGNSPKCVAASTDKHLMRRAFERGGDPSPRSLIATGGEDFGEIEFDYPIIVKPSDRSGSRGITKLDSPNGLHAAYCRASDESFSKTVLIEEYVTGREFSVESISWQGRHQPIAITEKFTSGAPHFVEIAHLEPARVTEEEADALFGVVIHALETLGVEYGASHAELKMDEEGTIKIIEIGARMGGGLIGSHLVKLSTGYDYVEAVIDIALGRKPKMFKNEHVGYASVRYFTDSSDEEAYNRMTIGDPDMLVMCERFGLNYTKVIDSSTRDGYFLFASTDLEKIVRYLPQSKPVFQ